MNFLIDYGLFFLKLFSTVVAILLAFAGIIAIASKGKENTQGKLTLKKINKKYQDYAHALLHETADKQQIKAFKKSHKKNKKAEKNRLFVLDFHGDIRASMLNNLREEITAILLSADPKKDEVLIKLESAGGFVNAYGLAASQLNRIRATNLKMTIAIDKVAASGGYMMACVADHIIAAPFAIIGSIGVIAQIPNFHQFLQDKHIDFEQITAGEYKRTLTMLGKNTEKGREKMQAEVNETHNLFKDHIHRHRPQVLINEVATGEHWFASQAKNFNLVDELSTSDDFLLEKHKTHDIFAVRYEIKKTLPQKFSSGAITLWHALFAKTIKT